MSEPAPTRAPWTGSVYVWDEAICYELTLVMKFQGGAFPFWGHPVGWTPIFEPLAHFFEPSAMERLDGEQEPNEKIHGGVFTGASSLWPLNINMGWFFGFVI